MDTALVMDEAMDDDEAILAALEGESAPDWPAGREMVRLWRGTMTIFAMANGSVSSSTTPGSGCTICCELFSWDWRVETGNIASP